MKRTEGRQSIFGTRAGGSRVQGQLTQTAAGLFERKREQLAHIARIYINWTGPVSDADTIEFLLRGVGDTKHYLLKRKFPRGEDKKNRPVAARESFGSATGR